MEFNWLSLLGISVGLAADALAVSIAVGLTLKSVTPRHVFRLGFHFGLFQFMMPIIGWGAGTGLAPYIAAYDHWIAFGLLAFIAVRMIRAALTQQPGETLRDPSRGFHLMALSVATSIDALAVGLALALLDVDIWWPSLVIGIITGSVCVLAIVMGNRLHVRFGRVAEIGGGVVLIAIALRILWTHLLY